MKQIVRGPLVLSVVDTRTGMQHCVAADTAALHRNSGRYPAICGIEVPAASLSTPAVDTCRVCAALTWGRRPDLASGRRSLRQRLRSMAVLG